MLEAINYIRNVSKEIELSLILTIQVHQTGIRSQLRQT